MKNYWKIGLLPMILALSCSETKFKGDGGARPLQLSCHPSAPEIEVGQDMLVIVNASSAFDGQITQAITKPDGQTDKMSLVKNGLAYVTSSETGNSFTFKDVGDYQVTLEADDENKTSASCAFKVIESPCSNATEVTGINVAFILDNSHSTGTTDCPERKKIGTFADQPGGVNNYRCEGETNREKAVVEAVRTLQNIANSAEIKTADAHSQIGIGYFPTKDNYISGSQVTTNVWLRSESDPAQINRYMNFAREPYGMTPYGSGLRAAETMFDEQTRSDARKELVVFITDGEPTDQNPKESAEVAARLHARDISVATIFVNTGSERSERVRDHLNLLSRSDGWFDRFQYSNFDSYALDLMGSNSRLSLVEKITSRKDPSCIDRESTKCERQFVEVNDWNQLKTVLGGIVRKSVQCK